MCWILCRRFVKFHQKQPHIYKMFDQFAEQMVGTGRTYYSATNVWGRMRWDVNLKYTDEVFKLNDHHTPYMARWWLDHHPDKNGSDGSQPFFQLRKLKNGGEVFEDPDSFPDDEKLWVRPPGPDHTPLPFPDPDDKPDEPQEGWLL